MEDRENLYVLGLKAKTGDDVAIIKIINRKRKLIEKYSYGNEDAYQYILEKVIFGIKNYKF